ncbi:hypothetical protein TA3x_002945 [Tundrisphaera sp. TA3]|uniref:hypothetical protein n=1 Tax=Tundrisphaera sp. TA3 TaxID=3435775 RepID=UPI003EBC04B2
MMSSVEREGRRSGLACLALSLLLVAEVLALAWFQSPGERFTRYIGNDSGVDLSMQDLIARGFRPTVDFACAYGLLPLLLNRIWYGIAGLTPGAYRLEVVLGTCVIAWGMARVAVSRRVGWPGIALIALAMPDILFPTNFTIVHVLEPALLVHALAEQSRGRRSSSLALATAACFVKPSMAYVYGACLLACIAAASRGLPWKDRLRAILPAAIVGGGLALILSGFYGVGAVLGTLVPSRGAEIYRLAGFGFFRGIGRQFWILPDAGLRDYFRYEVGFWLIGSVGLVAGGLVALIRLARGGLDPERARDAEIVACCATLHAIFVTCFFAHRTSWTYYFPILILGLAVLGKGGRGRVAFAGMLAVLLLVNDRSKLVATAMERRAASPSGETLGLWSTPDERAEWRQVLDLSRGHRPVLLGLVEGSVPLAPKFAGPIAAYLCPGLTLPIEVRRKADQIASAEVIVVMVDPDWVGFRFWPELAGALDGCDRVLDGQTFRVYRRSRPPRPISAAGDPP